jgi:hypothetical protein
MIRNSTKELHSSKKVSARSVSAEIVGDGRQINPADALGKTRRIVLVKIGYGLEPALAFAGS